MYQACIFDFDGTLCDSVESIAVCANHALRDLNLEEASLEEYKIFVGDGVMLRDNKPFEMITPQEREGRSCFTALRKSIWNISGRAAGIM